MKIKIVDFIMTLGNVCGDNERCETCKLRVEEEKFHGCVLDKMNDKNHAELIKKVVVEKMKERKE